MKFVYKNKEYEVLELHDIGDTSCTNMVALFGVQYCYYENNHRVVVSEEEFLDQSMDANAPIIVQEYKHINHFEIDAENHPLIETCQYFIDHQFDKDVDELKYLLMEWRKAQKTFDDDVEEDNDTKSSLDALEYAQSDVYDWVHENIQANEEGDK